MNVRGLALGTKTKRREPSSGRYSITNRRRYTTINRRRNVGDKMNVGGKMNVGDKLRRYSIINRRRDTVVHGRRYTTTDELNRAGPESRMWTLCLMMGAKVSSRLGVLL